MGLRINTNVASQEVQKNLKASSAAQELEFAKLSSGNRITKAGDDAAGLAVGTKLDATTRGLRMANRNANDAVSLIQVAEGALNETSSILTRLRELSIQSASDTLSDNERELLNLEYEQLVFEADRISKSTSFNGRNLLIGEGDLLQFQVCAYEGDHNIIEFDSSLTDASSENLGIDGSNIKEKDEALSNLEKIDEAIHKVSGFRANFGSVQSRLQTAMNTLEVQAVNQEYAKSRIMDVDIAESTAKLASAQIKQATGVAALAQSNQITANALKLVG